MKKYLLIISVFTGGLSVCEYTDEPQIQSRGVPAIIWMLSFGFGAGNYANAPATNDKIYSNKVDKAHQNSCVLCH